MRQIAIFCPAQKDEMVTCSCSLVVQKISVPPPPTLFENSLRNLALCYKSHHSTFIFIYSLGCFEFIYVVFEESNTLFFLSCTLNIVHDETIARELLILKVVHLACKMQIIILYSIHASLFLLKLVIILFNLIL